MVILAHGHPDYSAGGAEMAAYSLFTGLRESNPDGVHLITWISPARAKGKVLGSISRMPGVSNEWLYRSEQSDWVYSASQARGATAENLIRFLRDLNPDVVHFHHFLGFGIDVLRHVRMALPRAKLVVTLHEYLAICLRDGQMVTKGEEKLCSGATPVKCSGCFPGLSGATFALRKEWFKRHFGLVDQFISPSEFLRDRYISWGIPADRIAVLENAQVCTTNAKPSKPIDPAIGATFAFFGQLTPYKGAYVLMEAASILNRLLQAEPVSIGRPPIVIHGTLGLQGEEFKERFMRAIDNEDTLVEFRGGYDRHDVIDLMASFGWIIVPSTWWENSPVVIEEAFHAGRPIICSDIGGMKEKVRNEVNGLHFRARDPYDLARVMLRCLKEPDLWDRLRANVRSLPTLAESAQQHHALYN